MNNKYIIVILICASTCFCGCLDINTLQDEYITSDVISVLLQPTFSFSLDDNAHVVCNMYLIRYDADTVDFISYEKFINISESNISFWRVNNTNFTLENKDDAVFIEGIVSYLEDNVTLKVERIINYEELSGYKSGSIYPVNIHIDTPDNPPIDFEDLIEVRATTTIYVYRSQTPISLSNEKVRIDFVLSSGVTYTYNKVTGEHGFAHLDNISFFISESDSIKITAKHEESGYFLSVSYTLDKSDKIYGDWYTWETRLDLFG